MGYDDYRARAERLKLLEQLQISAKMLLVEINLRNENGVASRLQEIQKLTDKVDRLPYPEEKMLS